MLYVTLIDKDRLFFFALYYVLKPTFYCFKKTAKDMGEYETTVDRGS